MLRSRSNLLRRTHWWNVQSSMAMDCFPLLENKRGGRGNELASLLLLLDLNTIAIKLDPPPSATLKEGIHTGK